MTFILVIWMTTFQGTAGITTGVAIDHIEGFKTKANCAQAGQTLKLANASWQYVCMEKK